VERVKESYLKEGVGQTTRMMKVKINEEYLIKGKVGKKFGKEIL